MHDSLVNLLLMNFLFFSFQSCSQCNQVDPFLVFGIS